MTAKNLDSLIESNLPIVDVRSEDCFKKLHLKSSANIPWHTYFSRLSELPDPAKDFIIVADDLQVAIVKHTLESRRHKPSQVVSWQDIQKLKLSPDNYSSGCACNELWSANPLLSEFLKIAPPKKTNPLYIDLACGAGRELVYMAQQGFQAIGYDRMPDCGARALSLAAPSKSSVEVNQDDIEHENFQIQKQADVISVFRFLHRPLLNKIDAWLAPQGYIVYQTFMQGCEKFGSPKNPNFLLKPNELATRFSTFDIKVNRVDYLPDGRPMQSFIAKKH
jgi:tellurite methyltransferase